MALFRFHGFTSLNTRAQTAFDTRRRAWHSGLSGSLFGPNHSRGTLANARSVRWKISSNRFCNSDDGARRKRSVIVRRLRVAKRHATISAYRNSSYSGRLPSSTSSIISTSVLTVSSPARGTVLHAMCSANT